MVLSGNTIQNKIKMSEIDVEPGVTEKQIQPASLDVRIGRELYDFNTDSYTTSDTHTIKPGIRYLADTKEKITLPNDIAAQLAGRSSTGRKGVIIHKTAGWIDPSFSGTITLEIYNLGDESVKIRAGERIGQLVFFELDKPSSGYDGKYQGQVKPTKSIPDNDPN